MFGFLIILCCVGGGLAFGVMLLVGTMFYSEKWTLPNTAQRRAQEARVRTAIARSDAETAQALLLRDQLEAKRDSLADDRMHNALGR